MLGTVTDVLQPGANDVYVVSKDGEPDQLFAAIEEVVKDIDVENKLMIVDLPNGYNPLGGFILSTYRYIMVKVI